LRAFPGDFRIAVEGLPDATYVETIRMNRQDILVDGLHLSTTSDSLIEITLGADGHTIPGTVVDGSARPFANATVALVPNERSRFDRYRTTTSDSAGAFALEAVPPGDYKLFAWEWAPPDAWTNAAYLHAVESRGTALQVLAGRQNRVEPIQI